MTNSTQNTSSVPSATATVAASNRTRDAMTAPLWLIVGAVAAAAALYINDPERLGGGKNHIVVMNTKKIIDAKGHQLLGNSSQSPAAAAAESTAFVGKLKEISERYTKGGYVILNSAYVVNWPDAVDVTQTVATELGVDLALAEKPLAAAFSGQQATTLPASSLAVTRAEPQVQGGSVRLPADVRP